MLIALSGGADSVALLIKLLEEGRAQAAAHCNFALRGAESDRDEQFVRELCRQRNVRLHVRRFDTTAEAQRTGESIEMAARRLRYAWFDELCRTHGYRAVAVAHHREDNAETLLINLIRGTGIHGLSAMTTKRSHVVRPLLDWSKSDILQFLEQHHQSYVTDSTNAETLYRRNKIRHELIPLLQTINPSIVSTLHDTTKRLAETEALYNWSVSQFKQQCTRPLPQGGITIDWTACAATPAPLTLLHEWLAPYGFTQAQMADASLMRTGGVIETDEWMLTRTPATIDIAPIPTPVAPTRLPIDTKGAAQQGEMHITGRGVVRWQLLEAAELKAIPPDAHFATMDADQLKGSLVLRSTAAADRFIPFGMKGSQLVSDYLTNRHRSRIEKRRAWVLCDAEGVVWLINERPAARVGLTQETRRVLLLQFSEAPTSTR